ncbi:hypothetical protein RA307_29755 [Xanthobacteraceae bacterium Astr-EGSB]|uniref:hypothetical protein n=1 Tax=Astrobacterium formosum TaxID=3069710 RepID=UPI0027AEC6B1|nr:hypothetical protein [Xanthobacteraceae bacterium Astr-EGSB]
MSDAGGRNRRPAKALLGVLVAILLAVASIAGADARAASASRPREPARTSSFDGRWSITIETDRGSCEHAYRVGLVIEDGTVTYEGTPYGRVTTKGHVRVHFTIGEQRADGSDRLSKASGAGVWKGVGSSGSCSGRWLAERRDQEAP